MSQLGSASDYVLSNGAIAGIVCGVIAFLIIVAACWARRRKREAFTSKLIPFEINASQVNIIEQLGSYSLGHVLLVKATNLRGGLGHAVTACAKVMPSGDREKDKGKAYVMREVLVMADMAFPQHANVSRTFMLFLPMQIYSYFKTRVLML